MTHQETPAASGRALRIIARVLHIVVALVFLAAAGLKALHPAGFADQIRSYGILPSLADVAAWGFIVAEIVLAAALLVTLWIRPVSWLVIIMLVFFIGITWYGIAIGLSGSCGCFGTLVHRSPEQVIIEDALMIAALAFGLVVFRRDRQRSAPWKLGVVTLSGVLAVLTTAFSGMLPVDDLTTALTPGRRFDSWPVESLYKDLNTGTHVVFLFSMEEEGLESDVSRMNTIAQQPSVGSAVGLVVGNADRLTELTFQYGLAFPAGALEPRFAAALYRTLPRVFVLSEGAVIEAWSGIPSAAEVDAVMAPLTTTPDATPQ